MTVDIVKMSDVHLASEQEQIFDVYLRQGGFIPGVD